MRLKVDGMLHEVEGAPTRILATVLRDDLGVTGVKVGCREGACGACVALVDGVAVPTCLVHLGRVDGAEVVTVSSASATPVGERLVEAIVREGGLQCGFCTPGVVCAAVGLAGEDREWSEPDVRQALAGHLCRCTGYASLIRAVHQVLTEVAA
jgi:aerobic-type carbon monoxide dehydrogenase small subunit (CoxS/CutS family)